MRIEHPNLVKVYDVGRAPETGLAYMIMEYESGGSLRDKMAEKLLAGERFSFHEALAVVRKIAGALEAVSEAGAMHRDVQPDNILFDAAGEPVLAGKDGNRSRQHGVPSPRRYGNLGQGP